MTQLEALRATLKLIIESHENLANFTGSEAVEIAPHALEAASTDGEGWVRVPREPTKKMLEAGGAIFWQHILPGGEPPQIDPFVWEAMVAAAPLSPAPASKKQLEVDGTSQDFYDCDGSDAPASKGPPEAILSLSSRVERARREAIEDVITIMLNATFTKTHAETLEAIRNLIPGEKP